MLGSKVSYDGLTQGALGYTGTLLRCVDLIGLRTSTSSIRAKTHVLSYLDTAPGTARGIGDFDSAADTGDSTRDTTAVGYRMTLSHRVIS